MTAEWQRLRVAPLASDPHVLEIVLNRPNKLNIMDQTFFEEVGRAARLLRDSDELRAAVISAEGKVFTAGLDLKSASFVSNSGKEAEEQAEEHEISPFTERIKDATSLYRHVNEWQACFAELRNVPKPVIACISGQCIGGGLDLVSWCDIRLCSRDAEFSIKETQIGIVADLGTLQRISKVSSAGFAREVAFTGDPFGAARAYHSGFVNNIFETKDDVIAAGRALASRMARHSPLVVQGTKTVLNYADEHNTQDSLNQVALWNSAFLLSDDLHLAVMGFLTKTQPKFRNKL